MHTFGLLATRVSKQCAFLRFSLLSFSCELNLLVHTIFSTEVYMKYTRM